MPVSRKTSKTSKTSKTPSVEQLLHDLEALVVQMESGTLSLEDSVAAYRRGVELVQSCQQKLSAAREDIRLLDEQTQTLITLPRSELISETGLSIDSNTAAHDDKR